MSITLAQAFGKISAGELPEVALIEFTRGFFQTELDELRFSLIAEAPAAMADKRLDALAGAVGEYLAKHYRLPTVPGWVTEPGRYLDHPWHVMIFNDGRDRRLPKSDAGLREFLTFSSPAEFCSRNIFTDAMPFATYDLRHWQKSRSSQ